MSKATVHVAIGLILHQSRVLVGWRHADQHQGNRDEFPGGKVEAGESAHAACRREVYEEVGIDIADWHVFDRIEHQYPDLDLCLEIFYTTLNAEECVQINPGWTWKTRTELTQLRFPKANQAILQRLYWPQYMKISTQLDELNHLAEDCALYWRIDPAQMCSEDLARLNAASPEQGQALIVNIELWQQLNATQRDLVGSIHLKQHQLMQFNRAELPQGKRCIAACHDLSAVLHAQAIGVEALIISPVLPTATHSEQQGIGWDGFAQLAQHSQVPVYALGGLGPEDLSCVQQHAGYGVAGIRRF